MSKNSQRLQAAYDDGYRLGRFDKHVPWRYKKSGGYSARFDLGYKDGKLAKISDAHARDMSRPWNRLLAWLCSRFSEGK